jgi:hypothetical protein
LKASSGVAYHALGLLALVEEMRAPTVNAGARLQDWGTDNKSCGKSQVMKLLIAAR